MIGTLVGIVVVVALMVGLTALYVAGEFAAVSARKTRMLQLAEQGNGLAKMMLPVLEDPHKLDNYIAASQVGITISSLVLGIYGQDAIAPLLEPLLARLPFQQLPFASEEEAVAGLAYILILVLLTTLQVVLGELVPKSLAIQYPERVAMATAVPMLWSANYIFKPLILLLNGSGNLLLRLMGLSHSGGHAHVHSPEEIEILVSESHEGGLIDAEERQLLRNAFRLGELTAGEVMVPRTSLTAAAIETPPAQVLRLAAETAYTRIPVYEGDLDHVIGFVHLRDLLRVTRGEPEASLRSILRELPYVPETALAVNVWELLNTRRCYIAIVFDEYGGTAGLISQEDLIEELFGELQDEFDQETALIAPGGDGRIVVRGDMMISSLNQVLHTNLPNETAHTLGGLVLDLLGRVPVPNDEVEMNGIRFRVEAVAGRSVREVSLALPPEMEPFLEEPT